MTWRDKPEDPADAFEREWEEGGAEQNAWDDLNDQPTVELERVALDASLPPSVRKRAEQARQTRARERALRQENERLHADVEQLHQELGRALLAHDDPTFMQEDVAHNRALMLSLRYYPAIKAAIRQLGPRASDSEVLAYVEREQARERRNGWREKLSNAARSAKSAAKKSASKKRGNSR